MQASELQDKVSAFPVKSGSTGVASASWAFYYQVSVSQICEICNPVFCTYVCDDNDILGTPN